MGDHKYSLFIAPDKEHVLIFFLFFYEMYVVGIISCASVRRTQNICFHGEIRKLLSGYPWISGVICIA